MEGGLGGIEIGNVREKKRDTHTDTGRTNGQTEILMSNIGCHVLPSKYMGCSNAYSLYLGS